jgi:hypothetical protein
MSNDCSWAERYAFRHLHSGSHIPSSEYRFWPEGRRKPYFLTIRFLKSRLPNILDAPVFRLAHSAFWAIGLCHNIAGSPIP